MAFEGGNGNDSPADLLGNLGEVPPQMHRLIKIGKILIGVLLLFFLLSFLRGVYTNLLWFSHLELQSVYSTILTTRIWLFVAGLVVMGALTTLSFRTAFKNSWGPVEYPIPERAVNWLRNVLVTAIVALSGVITLIFASVLSGRWESFLKLINSVPFNIADPVFNKDVSFYIFTMPALHTIQGWLMGAAIVLIFFSIVIYFLVHTLRGVSPQFGSKERNHFALLGAFFMITVSGAHFLDRYEILFSTSGAVTGATYADLNARMNALWLLTIVALLSAAIMLATLRMANIQQALRWLVISTLLWIVTGILAGILWPSVVQRLIVNPSELEKETPYIARSIEWTQMGFDLDRATEKPYEVREELIASDLVNNPETVNNIRLWDPRPLSDVYNQIQHLRLYYSFKDVDVDRYMIDGEYLWTNLESITVNTPTISSWQTH